MKFMIVALLLLVVFSAPAQIQEVSDTQVIVTDWVAGPLPTNPAPTQQGVLVLMRSPDPGVTAYLITVHFTRQDNTTGIVARLAFRNDNTFGFSSEAFAVGAIKSARAVVGDLRIGSTRNAEFTK